MKWPSLKSKNGKNVNEEKCLGRIATWSQFHQHFTHDFSADILVPKNCKAERN